jgi:hypothetical protein
MHPAREAAHVQLSDDNFAEITPGGFAVLSLSQGVQVSVRWETRAFEVRDTTGALISTTYKFRGLTTVLVSEDFVGTLTYGCSGCSGSGRINLVPAVHECIEASAVGDEHQRAFTSRGSLDESRSCRVQCVEGFYRTHSLPGWRCEPHWEPVCGVREFLVLGTSENNAYCRPCSGCAGQRLVRNCSATSNDGCAACGEGVPLGERQIWTNAHGADCTQGCEGNFVLDRRARVCESCLHRCPAGYGFPPAAERDNCTHCAACETLPPAGESGTTRYLPVLAVWDDAEDRDDCVATCRAGYALVVKDGRLECTPTSRNIPPPIQPARSLAAARCAGAGDCLLPGCTLHEQVCTACFDLPEALQRGRFGLESQELLPETSLSDRDRFRWQFLGGCEWACLSSWVSIQSEDGRYWKCENNETVHNILMREYWDRKFSEDSAEWFDKNRGSAFFAQTSSVLLVGALAFVALLVLAVGIKFTRECCRDEPPEKRKM